MSTGKTSQYTLALTADERETLVELLEEALKETQVEEHRTEAFSAREVVRSHESKLESILRKARDARPA